MSSDEAEKAAREWEERQENTFWYESVYHVAYMAFMAGRKDGVEWERKTRHEKFEAMAKKVSESMRNLCTKYGTIQTLDGGRLIEDKEGGE